jgi:hypothetical protein
MRPASSTSSTSTLQISREFSHHRSQVPDIDSNQPWRASPSSARSPSLSALPVPPEPVPQPPYGLRPARWSGEFLLPPSRYKQVAVPGAPPPAPPVSPADCLTVFPDRAPTTHPLAPQSPRHSRAPCCAFLTILDSFSFFSASLWLFRAERQRFSGMQRRDRRNGFA